MHGIITALITPFTETKSVDYEALEELLSYQLQFKPSAILVLGSTAEAHALDQNEKDKIVKLASQMLSQTSTQLMVGVGDASTDKTIKACAHFAQLGADHFLVVCPYYVRPTQKGLMAHFKAVADASPRPIYLYNVPSRTAVDLHVQTAKTLLEHENIVGIKEATGQINRISELVDTGKAVLSGDDGSAIYAIASGASGVISVTSNWLMPLMQELAEVGQSGNDEKIAKWLHQHADVFNMMGDIWPNPIPIKMFLSRTGLIKPSLRLPLQEISNEEFLEHFEKTYQQYAHLARFIS